MIDNINSNLTQICFYESYIDAKIMSNLCIKFLLKVTTKLDRVHIDLYRLFSNIFPHKIFYIWTVTN